LWAGALNAMAGSSDRRIAIDTDDMRDISATYTGCCSNAIQIEVCFNIVSMSVAKIKIAMPSK
jgi:hypothetical protein